MPRRGSGIFIDRSQIEDYGGGCNAGCLAVGRGCGYRCETGHEGVRGLKNGA